MMTLIDWVLLAAFGALASLLVSAAVLALVWLWHWWQRRATFVNQWDAVVADKHAEQTERMLLGHAEHAKLMTAADRARKRREGR
jgi:hypothetical protein